MKQTRLRHGPEGLFKFVLLLFILAAFIASCEDQEQQEEGQIEEREEEYPGTEVTAIDSPYRQTQDSGKYTAAATDSNHIRIVFTTTESDSATPCERIDLVQVIQMFADGNPIKPGTYFNGFGYRDPTALDDDPNTAENESGIYVDHTKKADGTPWGKPGYNAPNQGPGTPGAKNGTTSNSDIEDAPQTGGGDNGFRSPTNAGGYQSVRYEFEVCAYCAKGHDCPDYFECITWVYEKTAADQAAGRSGRSRVTGQSNGPSAKFKKAVGKFNTAKGYTPCTSE